MKVRILLLILAGVSLAGCAGIETKNDKVFPAAQGKIQISGGIPAPQSGLVIVKNGNEGVWAQCLLLEGYWSRRGAMEGTNLIAPVLAMFEVWPAPTSDFPKHKSLITEPYGDYTLYIIFTDMFLRVVGRPEVVRFSVSEDIFRDEHIDYFGNATLANRIIDLPRVKRIRTQLRFHKTLNLAEWLRMMAFGM